MMRDFMMYVLDEFCYSNEIRADEMGEVYSLHVKDKI
jgi:hypothetical protein